MATIVESLHVVIQYVLPATPPHLGDSHTSLAPKFLTSCPSSCARLRRRVWRRVCPRRNPNRRGCRGRDPNDSTRAWRCEDPRNASLAKSRTKASPPRWTRTSRFRETKSAKDSKGKKQGNIYTLMDKGKSIYFCHCFGAVMGAPIVNDGDILCLDTG